jgi:ATP-dependent DNA ligase
LSPAGSGAVRDVDDGEALYAAVYEHGLEDVVSKKRTSRYRSCERGWVTTKNPAYWRRE